MKKVISQKFDTLLSFFNILQFFDLNAAMMCKKVGKENKKNIEKMTIENNMKWKRRKSNRKFKKK